MSGVGTAVGHVTSDIQQVIGAETNAVQQITNSVVAGIKSILPFPL
jgi:threonine dehydratase